MHLVAAASLLIYTRVHMALPWATNQSVSVNVYILEPVQIMGRGAAAWVLDNMLAATSHDVNIIAYAAEHLKTVP